MKFRKSITPLLIALLLFILIFLVLTRLNNNPTAFTKLSIINAFNIKDNKIDLINAIIAIGTMISAIGLCCFSYLTYKNQKSQEFETLYCVLLNEHNKLLSQNDFPIEVVKMKDSIIKTYRKSVFKDPEKYDAYLKIEELLNEIKKVESNSFEEIFNHENLQSKKKDLSRHATNNLLENDLTHFNNLEEYNKKLEFIRDEINKINFNQAYFENKIKNIIDKNHITRPYLIILFRILKYIFISNKISTLEKREYSGLVRSLINEDTLFIILLNSKGWEINKNNNQTYPFLLKKSEFFEHFNVPDFIQNNFTNESNNNIKKEFIDYLTQGQAIDKAAFGKNIFI